MDGAALKVVYFARALPDRAVIVILMVLIVLIDSASRELSNGGHIVFWSIIWTLDVKFWLQRWIWPSWAESRPVFSLIDSQFGSNQAHYVPNR